MTPTEMKKLPVALIRALGTGAAVTLLVSPMAIAQQATPTTPQQPQKIEKIEVTGSNIKRVDTETVSPVQIITREDIEKTGKLTIGEVLRDIPSNVGNSFNETFTNSFSPGSSGISLRGLGQKATLVLINGRRMANYGFAQNLQDTFVDLNSIPNSAVERVEILRDGSSAIYGADAVAGVVNIILRKDYKGLELSASGGTRYEKGMNEYRASLTGGIGDLARDRYNILGVVDYYHRDLLTRSETSWLRSGDNTQFPAGTLAGFVSGGATLQVGAGPNGFGGRLALNPCPPGSSQRPISDFDARRLGTVCAINVTNLQTLFPKSDRVGALTRGTFDISANLTAFAEANYSKNKTSQVFTPSFAPTSQVDQATGLTVTTNIILPAGHPNNPTGAARILQYTFLEAGGRNSEIETDAARGLAGLRGTAGKWDWEVALGAAQSKTVQSNTGLIDRTGLTAAFISAYDFSRPNAALLAPLKLSTKREATSKLSFADAKVSGEIAQLPAGPLGFAAGIEYRRESLKDRPDAAIVAGRVLGFGGTATDGSRNSNAIYSELSVPIVKGVEAQLAARRDDYSDFGAKTSPKVGLKWTVSPQFLVRGTSSRGFRAPSLPEASPSRATFFFSAFDPVNQAFVSPAGTVQSNPNLKPETSKSNNIGFVFEPNKNLNMSFDFYKIRLNDTIQIPLQATINADARGTPRPGTSVTRDANGNIIAVSDRYLNLDFQETSGFDFDVNYSFNALGGKITLASNYGYVRTFKVPSEPGGIAVDVVDQNSSDFTSSTPRFKGNLSGTYKAGDWTTSLTYRYVHSTDQVAAGTPFRAGATAPELRVGAYYDVDLFAAYEGVKNLRMTLSVRNALNKRPPFDPSYGSGIDFTQYDARGRFYTVGATYTFR
jgi:iron complex outermembrane recepter protein